MTTMGFRPQTDHACVYAVGWKPGMSVGWEPGCMGVVGVCLVCGDCAVDLGWNREGADGDV